MSETNDKNMVTVPQNDLQLVLECAMRAIEGGKLCVSFSRENSARGISPAYSEEALHRAEQKLQQEHEVIERVKQLCGI